jgi:hypothetical protein
MVVVVVVVGGHFLANCLEIFIASAEHFLCMILYV